MTRSTDPRLAVVGRWYAAYDARDVDALCDVAHPDVHVVPVRPLLSELPGTTFHGHAGVRTLGEWSWGRYPALRLESVVLAVIPGWILGSAQFLVDDTSRPQRRRRTETLFGVESDRIRVVRSFLGGALEAVKEEPALTPREREIFQLLGRGLTSPQIAEQLVLAPTTVRKHVQNAMDRLGARTRMQALSIAISRGEIQP
jgi:DNA-binding CsgD family transcriptional regulator